VSEDMCGRRSWNVNIESLKKWAYANLPASSMLRKVIILEKTVLTVEEFLAKMGVWMKLYCQENATN
jgi:hypothetical protein